MSQVAAAVSQTVPIEVTVDEARERVLSAFSPLGAEAVDVGLGLGRILAEPVIAPIDLPPFTNSAMDGYAVRAADISKAANASVSLPVASFVAAGASPEQALSPHEAARIMTGAPLPAGADTVVPFELVDQKDGRSITVRTALDIGSNVRDAGSDVRAGTILLPPGTPIRAPQIGLLSSLGFARISVHRRPRIAVLATGDEVVQQGMKLPPGRIWDANTPMLSAMIAETGAIPIAMGAVGDDAGALAERLADIVHSGVDMLVTSGGVSEGDFDVVKEVLQAKGAMEFWRVRMKPGRPLAFGAIGSTPVLGLPGNPVAAAVAFLQFWRSAILAMQGVPSGRRELREIPVVVRDELENHGGRRTFARVIISRNGDVFEARLAGPQGSSNVHTFARSNGLLVIPEDVERVQPGMRLMAQMPGWSLD